MKTYTIKNNQYLPKGIGNPAKTYYYIVNSNEETYNRKKAKFGKSPSDLQHYAFSSIEEAECQISKLIQNS